MWMIYFTFFVNIRKNLWKLEDVLWQKYVFLIVIIFLCSAFLVVVFFRLSYMWINADDNYHKRSKITINKHFLRSAIGYSFYIQFNLDNFDNVSLLKITVTIEWKYKLLNYKHDISSSTQFASFQFEVINHFSVS